MPPPRSSMETFAYGIAHVLAAAFFARDPVAYIMHTLDTMTEGSKNRAPVAHTIAHTINLDEYIYYAKLKRNAEKGGYSGNGIGADGTDVARPSLIQMVRKMGNNSMTHQELEQGLATAMKEVQVEATAGLSELEIEKLHARRLVRVASWSTIFYLITTDVLGPFNAPWATANLGIVPGVMLYFFFGLIAGATGLILSYLYNRLDSDRYPIKTYGDLAERVGGPPFRHISVVLQGILLLFTVALAVLSAGQSLYQISSGRLCFSVCLLIWALIGMIIGQIISLRNVGVLGSLSLYVNLLIVFISMYVVAHSSPDFEAADAANDTLGTGPVIVKAFNSGQLVEQVGGMFNLVFTFGDYSLDIGAVIFPEMMAEMRRPLDFYKGMICAQILISVVYLMYGVFWYCFQGQYTQPNSFQGISPFAWRTAFDAMNMITIMILAILYANIGIKVFYITVVENMLKGPPLSSKMGRIFWTIFVPFYWAIAFIIASVVPALGALLGLFGAITSFHFTYTFPPLFLFLFEFQIDAASEDDKYTGYGSQPRRIDTWRQFSRWRRGLLGGRWYVKLFMFTMFLAALACTGLGLWGTGESVKQALQLGQATSFGCLANA